MITKNCNNCMITFDKMEMACAYCDKNPTLVSDNFQPKIPKINKEEFNIHFKNFDRLLDSGWNWDIEEIQKSQDMGSVKTVPLRNVVIYLDDIILTAPLSKALCMLSWETCKERVSDWYNLPMENT